MAPLLVELTRFYLRVGVLRRSTSLSVASPSCTPQSTSRGDWENSTTRYRRVEYWLCQVLLCLVNHSHTSRSASETPAPVDVFSHPTPLTPLSSRASWLWVVLQEWVVAIIALQEEEGGKEKEEEEGEEVQQQQEEKVTPHASTHSVSGGVTGRCKPPADVISSSIYPATSEWAESIRERGAPLNHGGSPPYPSSEESLPSSDIRPSWRFFAASVVCFILSEEVSTLGGTQRVAGHTEEETCCTEDESSSKGRARAGRPFNFTDYTPTLQSLQQRYASKSRWEVLLWLCFLLQSHPGYRSALHVEPPISPACVYHRREAALVWKTWMHITIGSLSKEKPDLFQTRGETGSAGRLSWSTSAQTILLLERVLSGL